MKKAIEKAIIRNLIAHLKEDISEAKMGIKRDKKSIRELKKLKKVV
jgi:hypothetical protein